MSIFDRVYARATGKSALYDLHPELTERIPIYREQAGTEFVRSGSYNDFYTSNTWVHKAVRIWKDNIAPLRVRVVQEVDGVEEDLDDHEISQRLAQPNPEMGPANLWEEWAVCMALGGEFGLEVTYSTSKSKILELWPRQPDHIFLKVADARYRRVEYYKIDDRNGEAYRLSPEEMILFKFYNPHNVWRGLSPISAVRTGVLIDQLAQAWTRLFFRNQARPDFAIIAPEGITPTEKETMMLELDAQLGGSDGLHRPMILEKGITDIKTFSWPPKDLEWLEQRRMSRDEIGAIFGVPDGVMGWGQESYDTATKLDGDMRALWTLTLINLVRMRDDRLTQFFRRVKAIESNMWVETDLSSVPQLQEDLTEKFEQFDRLAQRGYPVNSLNEYFELGLPTLVGGEVGYLPMGMIAVTSEEGGKAALRASLTSAISVISQAVQKLSASKNGHHDVEAKVAPEYGSSDHEKLWKARAARLDKPVKEIQRIVKREIQRQQNEVSAKLRASRTYGRGKHVKLEEAAKVPDPDELFNLDAEIDAWVDALLAPVKKSITRLSQADLDAMGFSVTFDPDRASTLKGIKKVLTEVAKKTNNTTWEGLVGLFQEAERNGEGIPAIQERLSAYFGDRKSDWQTERIARTTMTGSANFGSQEAMEQAMDELDLKLKKVWVSALLPDRSREDHMNAHGQERGLDEKFDVGGEALEYPGDPSGSPGNIINCLCDQVYEEA